MRPGQLGVVILGRVIIGDIAVTLVDLAIRSIVRVEQADRPNLDWSLRPLRKDSGGALLGYEHTLNDARPAQRTGPDERWRLVRADGLLPRDVKESR
jgi:hypothetical protein